MASFAGGCSAGSSTAASSGSSAVGASNAGCLGGCLCWATATACTANGCVWTQSYATAYVADGAAVDAGLQGACGAPQSDAAPTGGW
jgi:hypothetical protein